MKYSWEDSIQSHLRDFSYISSREKECFLKHKRFNIQMKTLVELMNKYSLDSIEFSDELMRLLFDNLGDYNDLKPYGVNAIAKLTEDEREFLENKVYEVKEELAHLVLRRWSLD